MEVVNNSSKENANRNKHHVRDCSSSDDKMNNSTLATTLKSVSTPEIKNECN